MPLLRPAAWLLGSLLTLTASSCAKNEPEPGDLSPTYVRYAQTQCADKWGSASTPSQLVSAATTYLATQGIQLLSAQAKQENTGAVCNACVCPTGLVLTAAVAPADVAALQALGFTLK